MHHLDTYFQSVWDSQRSFSQLVHQWNQLGMVRNTKLCLPNHIVVHGADWFKCHFWQLYFKADWLEIHFLFAPLFSLQPKTCCLYRSGLHLWRSIWQQSLIKILWREREVLIIKAAEKDPSATIVASICSTGVSVCVCVCNAFFFS